MYKTLRPKSIPETIATFLHRALRRHMRRMHSSMMAAFPYKRCEPSPAMVSRVVSKTV
jgi:hypothetical protein